MIPAGTEGVRSAPAFRLCEKTALILQKKKKKKKKKKTVLDGLIYLICHSFWLNEAVRALMGNYAW